MPGKPLDDETLLKFWIGEVLHAAIQDVMSKDPEAGVLGHEVPIRDDALDVSGRADSVVQTAKGIEVLEFKTIDSNSYRYANLPYESHIEQEAIYLALESEFGPAVGGRIVYFGKQDGDIREFNIEATPELAEYVKGHLARLNELLAKYRETGELPERIEGNKLDPRIRYCEYLDSGLCCGDRKPVQATLLEAS